MNRDTHVDTKTSTDSQPGRVVCAEALITPVDTGTSFGRVVKELNRYTTCNYLFTSGGYLRITGCVHVQ